MRETIDWLNYALAHLQEATSERAKTSQTPNPDLVVYYIEHADWAILEALELLKQEEEETCEKP